MDYECILCTKENNVATIALNRPQKLNALNAPTRAEVARALHESIQDREVRVLVFTGTEKVFCAGADIEELTTNTSAHEAYRFSRAFQHFFEEVRRCPKPTIAAVSGYALGGGCELALSCDFRIAAENARFGLPEVALGAIPAAGGTQMLPRLLGAAKAKEMLMLGEPVDAQEACRIGLADKVVPVGRLREEAGALAKKLIARPALALEALKAVVETGLDLDLASGIDLEARSFAMLFTSRDFKEGTKAFLEKRAAIFTGE